MIPDVHGRSTSDDSDALQNNTTNSANFICGVVEGFYGRPWTSEQRKKLFKRMNVMGMNTYIYAPKDDSKHRMYWRELYTVEEAEMLTALVEAAEENGVTFVYALSPGLDMTYSSAKEVSCLKRKLTQVSSFGCKAFALLFDDIEVDMCEADKGFFQSFAFAQVSVTNEVYQHLHEPEKFFFCPTEYCASRAVPSVEQSEYLQTVGSKLLKGIDVMWTGPKVISKRISIKSIEELTAVLRRPPLIWDNIHANDYDQKRIFLGPYDGRSPELIPYLRGVLTNPNCEFESNFIALHTLAQWSRSNAGGVKKDCILSASPVNSADIKLETDGEYRVDEDTPAIHSSRHSYQAKQALRLALIDWHKELFDKCSAPRRLINSNHSLYPSYSFPTILPPAPILDPKSSGTTGSDSLPTLKTTLDPMAVLEMTDTYVKPPSAIIPLNGLIDQSSSSSSDDDDSLDMNNDSMPPQSTQLALQDYSNTEPMDYAPSSSSPSPTSSSSDAPPLTTSATADHTQNENDAGSMVIDTACDPAQHQNDDDIHNGDSVDNKALLTPDSLTSTHVSHLVDLFYLPFEHGRWSVESLSEFHWLKTNCPAAGVSSSNGEPTDEWKTRSVEYIMRLRDMCNVIDRLCSIPNKALLHEIYPYVWDIKAAMVLIASFVQWLGQYKVKCVGQSCLLGGPYSWGNRGYGDYTLSGEREPWLFRGGVLGEFQRMLPFECCTDLLFYTIPESPRTTMFNVRPYTPADLESVYRVCVRTYNDGCDGSHICPTHPQVLPDRLIGAYLHDSSDMCFVIEDDTGCVCGYVLSCTDARSYFNRYHTTWIPLMTSKYPQPSSTSPITSSQTAVSPAQELINEFYCCHGQKEISLSSASPSAAGQCTAVTCQPPGDSLLMRHPSILHVDMLRASLAVDPTAPVRALACAAAALKVAGSCGVFTKVDITHTSTAEFYRRLGFFEIPYTDPTTKSSSTTQPNTSNNSSSLSNANTSTTTTDTRTSNNLNHSKFIHMGRII